MTNDLPSTGTWAIRHAAKVSLICRIAYAAMALANLAIFFYWRGDANNLSLAGLLVMFIYHTKLVDMWRATALDWQHCAANWRESAAIWRAEAQRNRHD